MIKRYQHLELPARPGPAALACLAVARPAGGSCEFQAVATYLAKTGQALRDAMARLRTIADDASSWSGPAAQAFGVAVQEPSKAHIDAVPDRYDGYARQLHTYAGQLDQAQADFDRQRARVQDALDVLQAAAAADPHRAPDCTAQECLAAAKAFQASYNAWVDEANACINGLKRIDTHDTLHNPHGMHAAVDAASSIMNEVSGLTGALALLSLPLCPELAAVLGAISMASSILKSVADVDRKVVYGENVDWRTLAFDALGSIPCLGTARGGAQAARAAATVERLAPKARIAAKTFGKALGHEYREVFRDNPSSGLRELKDGGGPVGSVRRTSWDRTVETVDEHKWSLLGYPASSASNAWDNHRHGWAQAIGLSAFRVTWAPFGALVPDSIERRVHDAALPPVAGRIGQ